MKKIIPFLLLLATLASCGNSGKNNESETDTTAKSAKLTDDPDQVVIAQVTGGNVSFVASEATIKSDWQAFLTNQPDIGACSLTTCAIVMDGSNYILVVHGTQGTENIRSAMPLELSGGGCLFINTNGVSLTCTTTDCASESDGCIPRLTSCTPCSGHGKCTKSVSNITTILPNIAPSTCS